MKGGGRKKGKGRVKEEGGRGIRFHLSRVADPDAIQQSKKLSSLGRLDDLGSCGSLVWLLLPASHHQLTEEDRTGKVLEEREGEREGRREGRREERERGKEGGKERGREREGERVREEGKEGEKEGRRGERKEERKEERREEGEG